MSAQVKQLSKCVCPICKKVFEWRSALSQHMRLMHLTNKRIFHKCNVCKKYFSKLSILNNHKRLHMMSTRIETVTVPEKKKKISEIYKDVQTETLYSSDSDCEYELLQTVIRVTNIRKCTHFCEYCEKGFINNCSLREHVYKKHMSTFVDSEIIEVDSNSMEINNKKLTESEQQIDNHLLEDDKVEINTDFINDVLYDKKQIVGSPDREESADSPDSDTQEIITIRTVNSDSDSNDKIYYCTSCNAQFTKLSNLNIHRKLHLKQSVLKIRNPTDWGATFKRKYSCQLCKRTYSQKIYLDNHMRLHESGKMYEMFEDPTEDKYLCMFCGKQFGSSSHLSVHIKLHTEGKKYLCSTCGKAFALERYLMNHYKTHTKEKHFSCEYCSKRFIHKGTLVEHLRIHAGIKPHECTLCNKKFTHYSGLTQHLQTHTDVKKHVCDVCGKSFRFRSHYRGHMRTHTGDKPFVCSICGRRFALSGSLVVHRRTHSGERPYQCSNCKKGFIKSCNLKQHLKTHSLCRDHSDKVNDNTEQDDVKIEFISQE